MLWWQLAQVVLGREFHTDKRVLPCVVASTVTFNPPTKRDNDGTEHLLTPDDADAAQGWPPGISNGSPTHPLGLSTEVRTKIMGNALNAALITHVLRRLFDPPPAKVALFATRGDTVPDIDKFATAQELLDALTAMSDAEISDS